MRRRVHYASWVVAAVSAFWLLVVCEYSIGRDRRQKRLEKRLDDLNVRLDKLYKLHGNATNQFLRVQTAADLVRDKLLDYDAYEPPPEPVFQPVLRGRGITKSHVGTLYIYEDWETQPNYVDRRYIARIPTNAVLRARHARDNP